MMYKALLVGLIIIAGGCASGNFNNALGAAYLAVATVADATADECGNLAPGAPCSDTSLITSSDRDRIRSHLVEADRWLDEAKALKDRGLGEEATSALYQAQLVLDAAEQILMERGVE